MWRRIVRLLAHYPSAVVAFVDEEGRPTSFRCRPVPNAASRALVVAPPSDLRLREGRAGLLCHRHNAQLWRLKSFHVGGTLLERDGRWVLVPDRLTIGLGHGGPVSQLRLVRRGQRTAAAYLARRGWERPAIDWHRFDHIKREVFG